MPIGARLRLDVLHTDAPYLGYDEPAYWESQMSARSGAQGRASSSARRE